LEQGVELLINIYDKPSYLLGAKLLLAFGQVLRDKSW
jgi:hypothetical protein